MNVVSIRFLVFIFTVGSLGGCSAIPGVNNHGVVPTGQFQFSSTYSVTYENLAIIGVLTAAVFKVVDPFAPNWSIQELRFSDDRVQYMMKLKKFHTGADGEARMVLDRRALALARESGFDGYDLLRYREGIESDVFTPQRFCEAEVRFKKVSRN